MRCGHIWRARRSFPRGLHLERAQAASQALAAIGLAAVVFAEGGRVLAANSLAEDLTDVMHWRAGDRVALRDKLSDRQLRVALGAGESPDGPVRSFPVRGDEARAPMVGHVLPVRLSARDIFSRSVAVLVLTPLAAPKALPVELVQSLFDLTPAENPA